jgi:ABC-type transport system involved in multi-copper enzyme maturation permease subunit
MTVPGIGLLAVDIADEVIPAWQWWSTTGVALAIFGGLLGISYGTRTGVIARATTKEAIRQPLFVLLLFLGLLLIVVNTFLPFFSLGEDIKMLKECGLATIQISGLLIAIWTASTSIASEIEGKTAMTLLSKPITRRQFVLGKYIGILQTALALLIPLMIVFCFFIFYKVGYDARESSKEVPEWWDSATMIPNTARLQEVLHVLPGFALIFLEIAVVSAISVAISTRAPMVVNMTSCLAIFAVGHLTPTLVEAGVLQIEIVDFMARLIATVMPNLESFSMSTAASTDKVIPPFYLLAALGYAVVYAGAAILLSFILFEDRDLA